MIGTPRQPSPGERRARRLALVSPGARSRWAVKPLGVAALGEPVLVGVSVPDARHHLHVAGPTGTGKTTQLLNLAIAEARAGRGLAAFDPKGDLVRDLLERLPAEVAGRLVVIDPDESEAPPALNLLQLAADPEDTTDYLVGVMAKVWAAHWGPRIEDLARHAVLTLAHQPGATLADLPLLLADPSYRRAVLGTARRTADPAVYAGLAAFWGWYHTLTPGQVSVQVGPLLARLRAVLSRRFAAGLLGVAASTFDLAEILNGGVLLVRLPPSLGDDTVRLVGSLLLAALLHAGQTRTNQPEHQRLDATLVVDECHRFLNLPIGLDDALAEARAQRVSLVLAHQHLGQLSGKAAAAVDANARNKVFFSLAPGDARALAHHVTPYFAPEDLTRRDAYGVVCRPVVNGRDSEPFSLHTRPAPPPWPGRAVALRAAARASGLPAAQRQALAEARQLAPARPHGGKAQPTGPAAPPQPPPPEDGPMPPRPGRSPA